MKTCQGKLVFVDDYELKGCKFLKTKKSISPSTEIENMNDLEILDVSKLLTNKDTPQQILMNCEPPLPRKISFNGTIKLSGIDSISMECKGWVRLIKWRRQLSI